MEEEEEKGEVSVVGEEEVMSEGEAGEGPNPATWTRGTIFLPEKKEIWER